MLHAVSSAVSKMLVFCVSLLRDACSGCNGVLTIVCHHHAACGDVHMPASGDIVSDTLLSASSILLITNSA